MLEIFLEADEELELPEEKVVIEHSLLALAKWESKWEKAFFNPAGNRTQEEMESYFNCMVVGEAPEISYVRRCTPEQIESIGDYIKSKQTATWFREEGPNRGSSETVTAELVYYWMIEFGIPFTCETWHLNKLLTLIKVCSSKQAAPKKMSKRSVAEQYKSLNAQRRQRLGTTG